MKKKFMENDCMKKEVCNNCQFYSRKAEVCSHRMISQGDYLTYKYKKEYRAFAFKHIFRKSTAKERRTFLAGLLQKEYENEPTFFGIAK